MHKMVNLKNILFVLLALNHTYTISQNNEILFIDFESEAKIHYYNPPQNIWQIATPAKMSFPNARSGQNVIITEAVKPYPVNNNSSFSITFYKSDFQNASQLWLEFYHYFDMDTLSDFGFVDFSINGEDWFTFNDFNLNFIESDHQRVFIYDNVAQGADASALITGESGTWVRDNYYWTWGIGYKAVEEEPIYPDSILIRFTFNSDEVDSNRAGWMIDDIKVSKLRYSDAEDIKIETFKVIPNPTSSHVHITNDRIIKSLSLYDTRGKKVIEETEINKPEYYLDIEFLQSDIYILIIEYDFSQQRSAKIIKI